MKLGMILLAGGKATRMGLPKPKPFLLLGETPIAIHSLQTFLEIPAIGEIVVVAQESFHQVFPLICQFAKPGTERQDSVQSGLNALSPQITHTIVHDAARPLIIKEDIESLIAASNTHPACALGAPVSNTLKQTSSETKVEKTISRENLWEVYTPQLCETHLLEQGLELARQKELVVTDELSLVELLGVKPKLIKCTFPNIKLTVPQDLLILRALLNIYPSPSVAR